MIGGINTIENFNLIFFDFLYISINLNEEK